MNILTQLFGMSTSQSRAAILDCERMLKQKMVNIHHIDPRVSINFVSGGNNGSGESGKSYDEVELPEPLTFIPSSPDEVLASGTGHSDSEEDFAE
jgi:hypothetical protein